MNETDVRQKIRLWVVNRAKEKPKAFADDTPILESGLLTSLDVVELVLFLEQLRDGEEIPADQLDHTSIRDVNTIYSKFFAS